MQKKPSIVASDKLRGVGMAALLLPFSLMGVGAAEQPVGSAREKAPVAGGAEAAAGGGGGAMLLT